MTTPPRIRRKTKPKGRHPHKALSAAFVRSAPPGRHCDGNGLYLYVQRTGTRTWIQRLVIRGRKRELGLGSVALVSLAEARERALDNRKLARSGGRPAGREAPLAGHTHVRRSRPAGGRAEAGRVAQFGAPEELVSQPGTLRPPTHRGRAGLGDPSADVLEILTPIWHTKGPTARTVHLRIRAVLEWAIAMDWRADNPCDRLLPVLGPQHDVVVHRRALPHREVAAAIERVRAADPAKVDTLAFEFVVLTAARGGEVRGAAWSEIDRENGVWTVPAGRMKTAREHRVPLCGRALEILDTARRLGDGKSPIVFVSERGKSLGGERMCRLLERHRIAAVPHGFRSSFRDWAAEKTDHPREVVEAALAHVVQNKVEAAYMRSDLFERDRVWRASSIFRSGAATVWIRACVRVDSHCSVAQPPRQMPSQRFRPTTRGRSQAPSRRARIRPVATAVSVSMVRARCSRRAATARSRSSIARLRTIESTRERKRDTRRKLLAGSWVLARAVPGPGRRPPPPTGPRCLPDQAPGPACVLASTIPTWD